MATTHHNTPVAALPSLAPMAPLAPLAPLAGQALCAPESERAASPASSVSSQPDTPRFNETLPVIQGDQCIKAVELLQYFSEKPKVAYSLPHPHLHPQQPLVRLPQPVAPIHLPQVPYAIVASHAPVAAPGPIQRDVVADIREASSNLYNLASAPSASPAVLTDCIEQLYRLSRALYPATCVAPAPPRAPAPGWAPVGYPSFRPQSAPMYESGWKSPQARRKRTALSDPVKCLECGTTSTPEWRRGPGGARTLCNACGLYHAKIAKRQGDDKATQKLRERRRHLAKS